MGARTQRQFAEPSTALTRHEASRLRAFEAAQGVGIGAMCSGPALSGEQGTLWLVTAYLRMLNPNLGFSLSRRQSGQSSGGRGMGRLQTKVEKLDMDFNLSAPMVRSIAVAGIATLVVTGLIY